MGFTKDDTVDLPDPNVLGDAVMPDANVIENPPAFHTEPTLVGVSDSKHEVVAHPSGEVTVHPPGFVKANGLPVDPKGKEWVDSHLEHTDLPKVIKGPTVDASPVDITPVPAKPLKRIPAPPSHTLDTAKNVVSGALAQAGDRPLTLEQEQAVGEHPYAATAIATPMSLGPNAVDLVTDKFKTPQQLNADKVANTKPPVVVRVNADGTSPDTDITPVQKTALKPIEPALVGVQKDGQEVIRSADGTPVTVKAGTAAQMKLPDETNSGWLQKHSPMLAGAIDNPTGDFSTQTYAEKNSPTLNRVVKAAEVVPDAIKAAPSTLGNIVSGGVHQARGEPLTPEEERVTGNHPFLATGVATASTLAHKAMHALGVEGDNAADKPAIKPGFAKAPTVLAEAPGRVADFTGPQASGAGVSVKSATRPGASASGANESELSALQKQAQKDADESIKGKQAIADAQTSADLANATQKENVAEGMEQFNNADKANAADYQKQAAETSAKYLKVADELVNSKIDRHKLFKDVAERGNTMQLVIGSLLYGFGAGGLGQDPDIISKLVDKNVADQETDLANHAKGGEMYNTHLGQLSNIFKDKQLATLALKNTYLEQAKGMLDATALRAGIPMNSAKVVDQKAFIDNELTKNKMAMQTHVLNTEQQRASIQGTKTDTALKGQTYQMNQAALDFRRDNPNYIPGQIVKNIYNKNYVVPLTAGNAEQQGKVAEEVGRVYQAHQSINDAIDQGINVLKNNKGMSKIEYAAAGKDLLGNILAAIENVRQVQGVNTVATSELFNATKKSLENGLGNDTDEIVKNWENLRKRADVAADSITTYHGMPALSTARAEYMANRNSPTAQYGRK